MFCFFKLNYFFPFDLCGNLDILLYRNFDSSLNNSLDFFFDNSLHIYRFFYYSIYLYNLVYISILMNLDNFFNLDLFGNNCTFLNFFLNYFLNLNYHLFLNNDISIGLDWNLDISGYYFVNWNVHMSDDFDWFFYDLLYLYILVLININNFVNINLLSLLHNSVYIPRHLYLSIDWFLDNSVHILRDIYLYVFNLLYREFFDPFHLDYFLYIFRNCDGFFYLFNLRYFDYSLERNLDSFLYISVHMYININNLVHKFLDIDIHGNIHNSINKSLDSFLNNNILVVGNLLLNLPSSNLSSPRLHYSPPNLPVNHDWYINLSFHLIDNFLVDNILYMFLDNIFNYDWLLNNDLYFPLYYMLYRSLYNSLYRVIHYSLNYYISFDISLNRSLYYNFIRLVHKDLSDHRSFNNYIILLLDYVLVKDWIDLMDLNRVFYVIIPVIRRSLGLVVLVRILNI